MDEFGFSDSTYNSVLGVVVRRPEHIYLAEPYDLNSKVIDAVERLGAAAAFTMSSEIVSSLVEQLTPQQTNIASVKDGFTIPVVRSIHEVGLADRRVTLEHSTCLCREEGFLLVWSNSVKSLLHQGSDLEARIFGMVCHICIDSISSLGSQS